MDRSQIILLSIGLIWICTGAASNPDDKTNLLPQSIIELKKYYEVVDNLEQRGVLTEDQAKKEKQLYIEYGSKLIGKDILLTTKEFLASEKRASIISFSNIIAILAGFVIFIAGSIFTKVYIIPNLTNLTVETWEKLLYFLAFLLMFLVNNSWLIFLGCLVFIAALKVSFKLDRFSQDVDIKLTISYILFFSWSIVALYQQNREVGYLAIAALLEFSSSFIRKKELPTLFGFSRDSLLPSITISSFFLMMTGCFLRLIPINSLTNLFTRPLLFIGTFGYFIGLIILSSKLYDTTYQNQELFYLLQIITFFSGLASSLIGPLFDIAFLQSIGGTILILWLLIKYIEYANWTTTQATITSLCGFGMLLYGFAYFYKIFSSNFHFG